MLLINLGCCSVLAACQPALKHNLLFSQKYSKMKIMLFYIRAQTSFLVSTTRVVAHCRFEAFLCVFIYFFLGC